MQATTTTTTPSLVLPDDDRWLTIPTAAEAGKGKRAPRRWATRAAYRLYPWYTRPYRYGEVLFTAAVLEAYCETSYGQVRVASLRAHLAPKPRQAILAIGLTSKDQALEDADGLHRGGETRWNTDGATITRLHNDAGEVIGREYRIPVGDHIITGCYVAPSRDILAEALDPLDEYMRQVTITR